MTKLVLAFVVAAAAVAAVIGRGRTSTALAEEPATDKVAPSPGTSGGSAAPACSSGCAAPAPDDDPDSDVLVTAPKSGRVKVEITVPASTTECSRRIARGIPGGAVDPLALQRLQICQASVLRAARETLGWPARFPVPPAPPPAPGPAAGSSPLPTPTHFDPSSISPNP